MKAKPRIRLTPDAHAQIVEALVGLIRAAVAQRKRAAEENRLSNAGELEQEERDVQ